MSEERLARLEDMMGQLIGMVGKVISEQQSMKQDMADMKQDLSDTKVTVDRIDSRQNKSHDTLTYLLHKTAEHDHDIHVLKQHLLKT